MTTKVTSKNFTKQLGLVATAFSSVRDGIQALVFFALIQIGKGNFTYANEMIQSKQFAGLSMNSLKIYIEAHADVELENTAGVLKFKSKKTKDYKHEVPTKTWYEFSHAGEATVVVPLTMLNQVIKRIEGALAGDGKTSVAKKDVKSGQEIVLALKVAALKAA